MYHIRHAGAKGLGVFAAKPIPRGTRILAEKPVFVLKSERDLFAATRNLSPSDLQSLKDLSINERHPPGSTLQEWLRMVWHVIQGSRATKSGLPSLATFREYQPILAAFRNNNFDIGGGRQAVFREISRLNHACVPNTQGNFNTNINAFTIHSLRPIEAEEEITVSYLEMFTSTRETRQSALYRGYGFDCTCPACDMTKKRARDGERKRVALKEKLYSMHQLQKEGGKRDHNAEMDLLKELIKFSETEGLSGRELGTMYLAAGESHLLRGEQDEALACAKTGLELEQFCLGTDSPFYQDSLRRMKDVEAGRVRPELKQQLSTE